MAKKEEVVEIKARLKLIAKLFILLNLWWLILAVNAGDDCSSDYNRFAAAFLALGLVFPLAFLAVPNNNFFELCLLKRVIGSWVTYLIIGIITCFIEKAEFGKSCVFYYL